MKKTLREDAHAAVRKLSPNGDQRRRAKSACGLCSVIGRFPEISCDTETFREDAHEASVFFGADIYVNNRFWPMFAGGFGDCFDHKDCHNLK